MLDRISLLWNLNIILESLPVSSSGHLKLLTKILSADRNPVHLDSATEHLMHIPNGLLILLFIALNSTLCLNTPADLVSFCLALMLTNLITGIVYLRYKKSLEKVPLSFGFLCSSLMLISLLCAPSSSTTTLYLSHALIIGLAQSVALIPGISRMAFTTGTGVWLGLDPKLSFIFSLSCELALILIAVVVALKKSSSPSLSLFRKLTPLHRTILAGSSLVSYGALWISYQGFSDRSVAYVGFYLIGISIFCFFRHKQSYT